jgi:hypothetical protein
VTGLVIAAALATAGPAGADDGSAAGSDDMGDQELGGQIGIALGGDVTPGGLRAAGHYVYKLTDRDWFDSIIAFTYGGGSPQCFHDRSGALVCTHGLVDGDGVELVGEVRHLFAAQGAFRPFALAGLGLGIVHFAADSLTGVAIPVHAGGGVRYAIATGVALVAEAELVAGLGILGRGLGAEPQFGAALTAGAEVRLR